MSLVIHCLLNEVSSDDSSLLGGWYEFVFLRIYLNLGSPGEQRSLYLTVFHRSIVSDLLPVDPANT